MYIYVIENSVTGKRYVGQTIQPLWKRFSAHVHSAKFNTRSGRMPISQAISKYGRDAFTISLVEECRDRGHMNEREAYWIEALGTLSPGGYNVKPGGGAAGHSEDTKNKIAANHIRRFLRQTPEERRAFMEPALTRGRELLAQPGAVHPTATLTWENVEDMRALAEEGATVSSIASRFGITRSHASKIVRRKIWNR